MNAPATLYTGTVMHRRLRPKRHALKHSCYWMLIDIDRVDEAAASMRLFSHNRFNVMSFRERDFGDGGAQPLRIQIESFLRGYDIDPPGGMIKLFCMPRVLGYGFNPLSVYFCHDKHEALKAIVYEVHNTFGERHFYSFACFGNDETLRHSCSKDFYVSPFMDMDLNYQFRASPPGETVSIAIQTHDEDGLMLFAGLSGQRRAMTDTSLLKLNFSYPLLTLKVIAAIHIHAAILWWKGVKIRRWKAGLRRGDPTY